eukprot:2194018-Amphidinium_carterae.1
MSPYELVRMGALVENAAGGVRQHRNIPRSARRYWRYKCGVCCEKSRDFKSLATSLSPKCKHPTLTPVEFCRSSRLVAMEFVQQGIIAGTPRELSQPQQACP